jgi:hypothetical protein
MSLRVFSGLLGASLLALSFLLYENEEGALQSKLEDIWIRMMDKSAHVLATHASFLGRVGLVTERLVQKVLGPNLLSRRVLGVSGWYSIGSLGCFFLPAAVNGSGCAATLFVVVAVLPLFLGTVPAIWPKRERFPFRTLCSVLVVLPVLAFLHYDQMEFYLAVFLAIIVGICVDVTFLSFARYCLRGGLADRSRSTILLSALFALPLLGCIFLIVILAVRAIAPPTTWGAGSDTIRYAGFLATLMNLPVVALAILFSLLALTFLLHRIFWPLPQRVVYAIQRSDLDERKKWARRIGLAAIGLAFSPLEGFIAKLTELL